MNMTGFRIFAGFFGRYSLVPLLLCGVIEYLLVKKGKSGWPLLFASGGLSAVCIAILLQPSGKIMGDLYQLFYGTYNAEGGAFLLVMTLFAAAGAFLGTIAGWLLSKKRKRVNHGKGERYDGK